MTNLEWLRTLDVDRMASVLDGNCAFCACRQCAYAEHKDNCISEDGCRRGVKLWLEQEHKEEIKPCANCGGEAKFVADAMRINPEMGYVQCCECHIRTPVGTKHNVINIWNRRIDDGKVDGD